MNAPNTDLHPVTLALVDSLHYSWAAAGESQTPFSAWLHISIEAHALSATLIALSARGMIGVDLFSDAYADIQDDLHTIYCVALERARGGAA